MSNDLYYSFISGFAAQEGGDRVYRSPSAAGFNPALVENGGPMWAAVVIYPTGGWLDNDFFDNFLWGNLDTALFTGWGLRIVDTRQADGLVSLVASYGDGAQVNDVGVPLSALESAAADGRQLGRGIVEKLILVAMSIEAAEGGTTLSLYVNGQRVAQDTGLNAYTASASKVSLGDEAAGQNAASGILINSAGYRTAGTTAPGATNANAGAMFRVAREAHHLGFLRNDATSQQAFDHLYLAAQAGGAVGTKENAPSTFAFITGYEAAASLPDSGGGLVDPPPSQQSLTPIALAVQGPGLTVEQVANCEWWDGYQPLDLVFAEPGPG